MVESENRKGPQLPKVLYQLKDSGGNSLINEELIAQLGTYKYILLGGAPGSGKTTIGDTLIEVLLERGKKVGRVVLDEKINKWKQIYTGVYISTNPDEEKLYGKYYGKYRDKAYSLAVWTPEMFGPFLADNYLEIISAKEEITIAEFLPGDSWLPFLSLFTSKIQPNSFFIFMAADLLTIDTSMKIRPQISEAKAEEVEDLLQLLHIDVKGLDTMSKEEKGHVIQLLIKKAATPQSLALWTNFVMRAGEKNAIEDKLINLLDEEPFEIPFGNEEEEDMFYLAKRANFAKSQLALYDKMVAKLRAQKRSLVGFNQYSHSGFEWFIK